MLDMTEFVIRTIAQDTFENFSRYFVVAALVTFMTVWNLFAIRRFKIRNVSPSFSQMVGETLRSFRSTVIYAINGMVVYAVILLADVPFGGFFRHMNGPVYYLIFPLMVVCHDAYFYWSHRGFHSRLLFRVVHSVHHKSHNPSPWTAYSFSIGEAVLQGIFIPFFILLVPTDEVTVAAFIIFQVVFNIIAHSGHEIYPSWLVHRKYCGLVASVTHHDLHHRNPRFNFGLYFRFWDRMMLTEHPQYEQIYDYVRSGKGDGLAYRQMVISR